MNEWPTEYAEIVFFFGFAWGTTFSDQFDYISKNIRRINLK